METSQQRKLSKLELAQIAYDDVKREHDIVDPRKVAQLESLRASNASSLVIVPLTEQAIQDCYTKENTTKNSSRSSIKTAGRDSNATQVVDTVIFQDLLLELHHCIRCSNKSILCIHCQDKADAAYSKCEARLMFGSRGASYDVLPPSDAEKMQEFNELLESKQLKTLDSWNAKRRDREKAFLHRIKEFDSSVSTPCHQIGQTEFCATGM